MLTTKWTRAYIPPEDRALCLALCLSLRRLGALGNAFNLIDFDWDRIVRWISCVLCLRGGRSFGKHAKVGNYSDLCKKNLQTEVYEFEVQGYHRTR